MSVKTYDPKNTVVTVAGIPVGGYADGTFIKVTRDEDAFKKVTGADGYTARVKSNNRGGAIEITLMQTSSSNSLLSALAVADELTSAGIVPVMVKDLTGVSTSFSGTAWVKKMPDQEFSKELSNRVWILDCADLFTAAGGNLSAVDVAAQSQAVVSALGVGGY